VQPLTESTSAGEWWQSARLVHYTSTTADLSSVVSTASGQAESRHSRMDWWHWRCCVPCVDGRCAARWNVKHRDVLMSKFI